MVSASVEQAKGITTWEEMCDKYQDCAERVLPAASVRQSMGLIENCENVEDLQLLLTSLGK